jgi:hypothetical protein
MQVNAVLGAGNAELALRDSETRDAPGTRMEVRRLWMGSGFDPDSSFWSVDFAQEFDEPPLVFAFATSMPWLKSDPPPPCQSSGIPSVRVRGVS